MVDDRMSGHIKRIRSLGKTVHETIFCGYPGLANTALKIAEYIPRCEIYVEPFAGLGRVAKHVKAQRKILNDKSPFAYNYLKTHFPHEITQEDFKECIKKYDKLDTFFLIDPPWNYDVYVKNSKTFCDRKPNEYYDEILELMKNSPSHWFVCSASNKKLKNYEGFYTKIILAPLYKSHGLGISKTKIYSNKPIIQYNQLTLQNKERV